MQHNLKLIKAAFILFGFLSFEGFAGNEDRAGQAGASELLINPWARSSGLGNSNSASIRGLEATYLNIAGTAFTPKSEIIFSRSMWMRGSGVNINQAGIAQKVGESGAMTIGVMSMSFGDIDVTTTELPDGGIGTYSPQYMVFNTSYAKAFSNSIYGGINLKVISESISNVNAKGICLDAGIQYVTTLGNKERELNKNNLKFGMALKNVGPPMKYSGDGLSFTGEVPLTNKQLTVEQRASKFEIPSLINIGLTYDYRYSEMHAISPSFTFTSNSFTKDQLNIGAEYSFKSMFMLRGGYTKELVGKNPNTTRPSALKGPVAGFSVQLPLGSKGMSVALDYAYRTTFPFSGVHSIGARLNL